MLHLGDFIYEVVAISGRGEDPLRPHDLRGRAHPGRRQGRQFHYPLTLDGYRAVYKGYLADPDLQDARARWPFVCIWDNHEFSWQGWQSILKAGRSTAARPDRQGRRQPGLVRISPGARDGAERIAREFGPPAVKNVQIEKCGRRTGWASSRTTRRDQQPQGLSRAPLRPAPRPHPHRPAQLSQRRPVQRRSLEQARRLGRLQRHVPRRADAGPRRRPRLQRRQSARRTRIQRRAASPNPQKDAPPQTILGAEQKAWFKDQLRASTATWKIWGNSQGTLDQRADPQNLPAGLDQEPWPAGTSPTSAAAITARA